jgi:two-component system sensor histidine kinase ChiS
MATKPQDVVKPGALIMVVDDDPGILRIVEITLQRSGYEVRTAPNGQEALKLLRKVLPDLLILDVSMPGLSGFDLCHIIRRDERLQHVPVIFFTAQDAPKDFQAGMDSGGTIYLLKPFKPERLLQSVRLALSMKPPAAAT